MTASPTDSANRSPEQVHSGENTSGINTAYASPRSSVSNGGSPHPSTKPVRFSLTSELASALTNNQEGSVPYVSIKRRSPFALILETDAHFEGRQREVY